MERLSLSGNLLSVSVKVLPVIAHADVDGHDPPMAPLPSLTRHKRSTLTNYHGRWLQQHSWSFDVIRLVTCANVGSNSWVLSAMYLKG